MMRDGDFKHCCSRCRQDCTAFAPASIRERTFGRLFYNEWATPRFLKSN